MTKNLPFLPLILASLTACPPSEPQPPAPPAPPVSSTTAAKPPASSETPPMPTGEPPPPVPSGPPVEFAEGTDGEAPAKEPSAAFKAPAKNQVISVDKKGDYEVKLDVKEWPTPEGGKHIHLIVDNQPYKRIDDWKQPVKLKDIVPGYELAEDQEHFLVAFPSRPTHESVKPKGKNSTGMVVPIYIGKKAEERWKPTDPLLVYSRPKGANNGPAPAEGILVDFFLFNVELGDGKYSVKATLKGPGLEQGKTVTIKSWKPWRIKNPRSGQYSLQIALLDKDGKPAPGPWNDTTRTFDVNLDAPPDQPHHTAPPASDKKPDDGKKGGDAKPASSADSKKAPEPPKK